MLPFDVTVKRWSFDVTVKYCPLMLRLKDFPLLFGATARHVKGGKGLWRRCQRQLVSTVSCGAAVSAHLSIGLRLDRPQDNEHVGEDDFQGVHRWLLQ